MPDYVNSNTSYIRYLATILRRITYQVPRRKTDRERKKRKEKQMKDELRGVCGWVA